MVLMTGAACLQAWSQGHWRSCRLYTPCKAWVASRCAPCASPLYPVMLVTAELHHIVTAVLRHTSQHCTYIVLVTIAPHHATYHYTTTRKYHCTHMLHHISTNGLCHSSHLVPHHINHLCTATYWSSLSNGSTFGCMIRRDAWPGAVSGQHGRQCCLLTCCYTVLTTICGLLYGLAEVVRTVW